MVIAKTRRGVGLGVAMITALERAAARCGVATLHYLLTTDTAPFFARPGYETRDRNTAPDAIKASREFRGLRPGSATYMARSLRDLPEPDSLPTRDPAS